LLVGSASVYETASLEVERELEWCIGLRFNCWNGMVRVYEPRLDFNAPAAPKRHRYFVGAEIRREGSDAIVDMLVRGVARRSRRRADGVVASIEDVAALEREHHLADYRAKTAKTQTEQAQYLALLEAENEKLEREVKGLNGENRRLEDKLVDQEDKISKLKYHKEQLASQCSMLQRDVESTRSQEMAIDSLRVLPGNGPQVLEVIEKLRSERIAFTDRARESVAKCEKSIVPRLWKCLWAMATELHQLFFSKVQQSNNIEVDFRSAAGYALAMTEGQLTKADRRMMRKRVDSFRGEEIDCTPHVKVDDDSTRVYFCAHRALRLIVVGYIGHLETAGTRRRGER